MTIAVLDDHLLRDVLAVEAGRSLRAVLRTCTPATTNLYLYRLHRSAANACGGQLTGGWSASRRRALARTLLRVPDELTIVPMASIVARMAELSADHGVSTLGAEAVAAAEHLDARLCVWSGHDGPGLRACATATGVRYQTVRR